MIDIEDIFTKSLNCIFRRSSPIVVKPPARGIHSQLLFRKHREDDAQLSSFYSLLPFFHRFSLKPTQNQEPYTWVWELSYLCGLHQFQIFSLIGELYHTIILPTINQTWLCILSASSESKVPMHFSQQKASISSSLLFIRMCLQGFEFISLYARHWSHQIFLIIFTFINIS